MDVEAGVSQLSDLLGQKLHPLGGVTEDNRLVDLKLSHGDKNRRLEPNQGLKMFPFVNVLRHQDKVEVLRWVNFTCSEDVSTLIR